MNNLQRNIENGVYKNDYLGFTVSAKFMYEFEEINKYETNLNSFKSKSLFKLLSNETKDTIEDYCFR